MRFALLIFSALIFGSLAYGQGITGPQATVPQSPLTIVSEGKYHRFVVELADDRFEQQRGLMFRQSVLPNEGMLFDFGTDFERAFWMRNTLVSLDMIFVRSDGTIHRIAAKTTPLSDASVPSLGPVSAVLELAGGRAAELGIKPGDQVRHQIFSNYPPMRLAER
nr:MAG: DUF192 domain-containing protein [Hyphomicrobiales bacterium]